MYRQSPYTMENEAYLHQNSGCLTYDARIVEEIEQSMNQMSICTPTKLAKKKPSVQEFMNLFNKKGQAQQLQQVQITVYCGVCSKETEGQCQCHCCSRGVCQKCISTCDRCTLPTCRICSSISYQARGDYLLCDYCVNQKL